MKNIYKNILYFVPLLVVLVIVIVSYKNECFRKIKRNSEFTHPATW